MLKVLNCLDIAIVLFIVNPGGVIKSQEYIPENANILVIEE
jgi:hypothetical protein